MRISRSYSVWFPVLDATGESAFTSAIFDAPMVEPSAENQPRGTSIELAFRGSNFLPAAFGDNARSEVLEDAKLMDSYGDYYYHDADSELRPNWHPEYPVPHSVERMNSGIAFLDSQGRWYESISAIDNALYYQVRVTFVSNPESGQSPELSALGVAWVRD